MQSQLIGYLWIYWWNDGYLFFAGKRMRIYTFLHFRISFFIFFFLCFLKITFFLQTTSSLIFNYFSHGFVLSQIYYFCILLLLGLGLLMDLILAISDCGVSTATTDWCRSFGKTDFYFLSTNSLLFHLLSNTSKTNQSQWIFAISIPIRT